jgi:hypothetical protein
MAKNDISAVVARLSGFAASPDTTPEEAGDIHDLITYASDVTAVLIEAKKWLDGQPNRSTSVYETNFAMERAIEEVLNRTVTRDLPQGEMISIFDIAGK